MNLFNPGAGSVLFCFFTFAHLSVAANAAEATQTGSPVYWVCLALLLATVALAARIASLW